MFISYKRLAVERSFHCCRSHAWTHKRVLVAISRQRCVLCIVTAIKIPSGCDKQSGGEVEVFRQGSERWRGEIIAHTEGTIDLIV